jgi:hypothetical protein
MMRTGKTVKGVSLDTLRRPACRARSYSFAMFNERKRPVN